MSSDLPAVAAADHHLTPAQQRQFAQDGYLLLSQRIEAERVARLREIVQHQMAVALEPVEFEAEVRYPGAPESVETEGGRTVRRLKNAVARHPSLFDLVCDPALLAPLIDVLGGPVACPTAHHNCVMTKNPRFSSDTGWHQDLRYWSFQSSELVSAWLALGHESLENGCLQVVPGSHLQTFAADRYDAAKFFRHDHPDNESVLEGRRAVELEPGDVLLFHARLLHAATRNLTDQSKLAVVFTFCRQDNRPVPGTRSAQLPVLNLPDV